jgi:hypothetical protein
VLIGLHAKGNHERDGGGLGRNGRVGEDEHVRWFQSRMESEE